MKKIFKISALILAVVVMCLSFSGCSELDDMREAHATWTEKGNTDSITYHDEVYRKIDCSENLYPAFSNSNWDPIYITEPDVPVLLSQELCVELQLSKDENFIYGYLYDQYETEYNPVYTTVGFLYESMGYRSGEGTNVIYCKESLYDEVSKKVEKGVNFTTYGYEYWYFDEKTLEDKYYKCTLTAEEAKIIDEVLSEKPEEIDSMSYDNNTFITTVELISEDGYFATYGYELFKDNTGNYSLSKYSDALQLDYVYEVPSELNDEFAEIFKGVEAAYQSSMQYIDVEY